MNITINNIENIFFIVKKMLSLWLKYKLINMKKTTFTDFKQNRTLKTKRWLGWLMFCMMLLYGQIGVAQTYCTPSFEDDCDDDHIDNFTIPSVSFSHLNTGCSTGQYSDYTSMTISFIAGATYSFTTTHGYFYHYVRAWIDFNIYGTFTNDTPEI